MSQWQTSQSSVAGNISSTLINGHRWRFAIGTLDYCSGAFDCSALLAKRTPKDNRNYFQRTLNVTFRSAFTLFISIAHGVPFN